MADGTIKIQTTLDNSKVPKDLQKLNRMIKDGAVDENMQNEINKLSTEWNKYTRELKIAERQQRDYAKTLENTLVHIQDLNDALDNKVDERNNLEKIIALRQKDIDLEREKLALAKTNEERAPIRAKITGIEKENAPDVARYNQLNEEIKNTRVWLSEAEQEAQKLNDKFVKATNNVENLNWRLENISFKSSSLVGKVGEVASRFKIAMVNVLGLNKELKKSNQHSRSLNKSSKIGIKKILKYGMALLGIRSVYAGLRKAMNAWTSATKEGKQAQVDLQSAWEGIGRALAPVFERLVKLLRTMMGYLDAIMQFLFGITIFSSKTGDNLDRATGSAKDLNKEMKQLAGFDEMNILSPEPSGGGGDGGLKPTPIEIPDITPFKKIMERLNNDLEPFLKMIKEINLDPLKEGLEAVGIAGKETLGVLYQGGIDLLNKVVAPLIVIFAEDIAPKFLHLLADILEVVNPLLERTLNEFIMPILEWLALEVVPISFELLESVIRAVTRALEIMWTAFLDWWDDMLPIREFLAGLFTDALIGLKEGFDELTLALEDEDSAMFSAFETMGKVVGILVLLQGGIMLVKGALFLLSPVISAVTFAFSGLWAIAKIVLGFFTGLFAGGILGIIALVALLVTALVGLATNFEQIKDDFFRIIGNITGFFKGLYEFIAGVFTLDMTRAFSGLVQAIGNAFAGIVNMVKFPLNIILDGVNAMIRGLNRVKIPNWVPIVGGKGLNIPQIPRLAKGGIVSSATTAMIGEQGREAVIPLQNNTEWAKDFLDVLQSYAGSGQGQSGGDIVIPIYLDSKEIAVKVIERLEEKEFATNGRMKYGY